MLCGRASSTSGDEALRLCSASHDPQARRQLQLGAVPVRFAQAAGQSLLVQTDGALLVAQRVLGASQLEDQPRVPGVTVDELLGRDEPSLPVVRLPERRDLALELVLTPRGDDLAPDRPRVVDLATVRADPAVDLGALRVAHERDDVAVEGVRDEGFEGLELGLVTRHVEDADLGEPLAEEGQEVLGLATAQVVPGHLEGDLLGSLAGDLAHRDDGLVGAVPAQPRPRRTAPPGAASPRATSSSASRPASLCAMSMMTVALPRSGAAPSTC